MLDIAFIRENQKVVSDSIKRRGLKVDLKQLLEIDTKRRALIKEVEDLRSQLKLEGKPSTEELAKAKKVKGTYDLKQKQLQPLEQTYTDLLAQVPNLIAKDTPDGDESHNRVERQTPQPKIDFKVQDHQTLAEAQGWLDFERGAKVAGSKFYFLEGAAVKCELALMRYGLDLLEAEGFTPIMPPHMVSSSIAEGTGFAPRGDEEQEYHIAGENLILAATAEVPLTGYHAEEILDRQNLPRLYAGLSTSYRKEAGAYGKHSSGLYRVHQFDKLEIYVVCSPSDSAKWLKKILALEERICQDLEIPYRVVRIASGELSAPAYQKYDIEYFSPLDNTYRELTSCSNCTDYQARNLGIRFRNQGGKTEYAHTLNGTAIAFSRTFIALLENHQQADGSVVLPPALHKYYGKGGL